MFHSVLNQGLALCKASQGFFQLPPLAGALIILGQLNSQHTDDQKHKLGAKTLSGSENIATAKQQNARGLLPSMKVLL